MDVAAAPERKGDQACTNGMIGKPIDDNERTGLSILLIGIKGDRISGRHVAPGDVVQDERRGGKMLPGVNVDPVLDRRNRNRRGLGADPRQI